MMDRGSKTNMMSTCGGMAKNFRVDIDNAADWSVVDPATVSITFPDGTMTSGRSTIEIVNEGPDMCRVWFEGSSEADGRRLKKDEAIAYAIGDMIRIYARTDAAGATSSLQVTEIV